MEPREPDDPARRFTAAAPAATPRAGPQPGAGPGPPAPPARLLIHAGSAAVVRGPLAWLSSGWRSVAAGLRPGCVSLTLALRIDDLHGRRHYACDGERAPVDVPLPAGTYHVTVRLGSLQRGYTLALQSGAVVEIHLPVASRPT